MYLYALSLFREKAYKRSWFCWLIMIRLFFERIEFYGIFISSFSACLSIFLLSEITSCSLYDKMLVIVTQDFGRLSVDILLVYYGSRLIPNFETNNLLMFKISYEMICMVLFFVDKLIDWLILIYFTLLHCFRE